MKVDLVNNNIYQNQNGTASFSNIGSDGKNVYVGNPNMSANTGAVSFKGVGNISKRFWFVLRQLSNYMKEPSEMTNALIAAIGTGAIAPFAIMCSPAKKTDNTQDKKVEREKKAFQALRQPVSAALAFGFQVPTTVGIAAMFNKLAYEKHSKVFNDEILVNLIPSEKYLTKQAKKALGNNPSAEILNKWKDEIALISDKDAMRRELMDKLKQNYSEVELEVSKEELEKLASKPKEMRKFLAEKMAKAKHETLINEKVKELMDRGFDLSKITDLDLVTEGYQKQARQEFKSEFSALKEKANLSVLDRFTKAMGFSNKKLKALEDAEKELAKTRGLELLKKEEPNVFGNDMRAKLRKFVENRDVKAQKLYGNKVFWFTLVTNLVMVAISCVALNWIHPKFASLVDRIKENKNQKKQAESKVDVRA